MAVNLYLDTVLWLVSIYCCAKISAILPEDPEKSCTELGLVLCRVATGTVPLAAVVTSARLVSRLMM